MDVYVRDDIQYDEVERFGFTRLTIDDGITVFPKQLLGHICRVLKRDSETNIYVVKSLDGIYGEVPESCLATVIGVRQTGANSGFNREYYRNVRTQRLYARQEERDNYYKWYSCTDDGEPDCPLKDNILMYNVDNEELYRLWRNE